MRKIALSEDFLNPWKILFSYGKMLEKVANGQTRFNPVAIEIHPTARCNHRCIHCSYKERNETRASIRQDIMEDLIESIINMGIRAVYFSGGGEPTLYPGLGGHIDRLYSSGVESSIITNGSCFEKMGLIPIANKLNYIAVSLPSIEQDTYQEITGTSNLATVLELPGKIKDEHGEQSPVVGARIILTNKNYDQVDEFLETTRKRRFDYALFKVVRDYEDRGQGLDNEAERRLQEIVYKHNDLNPDFTNLKSIFNYRKLGKFKNKCWVNQYGMLANVGTDGRVFPNIVEIDNEYFCIGNLYEETLENMWNSLRHEQVKQISNEKWAKGECRNCRAMAYNQIINELCEKMPSYYDPFI